MPIETVDTGDLLTLMQWLSPSYPIGAFSYSHGLEAAIDEGTIVCARSLTDWVTDVLEFGAGTSDALFLAAAYHADAAAIADIDAHARAFAGSAERLKETSLQGAAFCDITAKIWDMPLKNLTYPVAVGVAARARQLPLQATASAYLHSFASNLASVGMRLIPLGQTEGNQLIHALHPLCRRIAADTAHGDLQQLSNTAFLSDIAAMRHETQYSRIYRT